MLNIDDDEHSESDGVLLDSDTVWLDDGLTSKVWIGSCRITRSTLVKRIEYLDRVPSVWPIPTVSTAYVVRLAHIPDDDSGKPYKMDTLINKCVRFVP